MCLTAASAAQEPGRSQVGKVMGNVDFEVSCHVKAWDCDEVGNGVQRHSCQHNIYWKRLKTGKKQPRERHRNTLIVCIIKSTPSKCDHVCHNMAQHSRLQRKAPSFNLLQLPDWQRINGAPITAVGTLNLLMPWMGKGKELVQGVKESLRDLFRLTRPSLKPIKINIPSKPLWTYRHDFWEEKLNTTKKSYIRKCIAPVSRLHTVKNITGKQCLLSTDTPQNLLWSIFIIYQEWSLRLKPTFFKVVDEGLLNPVFLWVPCRERLHYGNK